ncbi:LCP family protein [Pseudonocardia sp.]|uniref:LCP family glycopolymer transferase n=1 Tax=Pseudonocardia sp. TaxID=60912 RepID=UPI002620E167|nr:LCP family protein [Pseudonocardia sp.]
MDERVPPGRDRRPHRTGESPWPNRAAREGSGYRRTGSRNDPPATEDPTRPVRPHLRPTPGAEPRRGGPVPPATTRIPTARPGPRTPDPRTPGPRTAGPRTPDPRAPDPRTPDPRTPDPRPPAPRSAEPRPGGPRPDDPRPPGPRSGDPEGRRTRSVPRTPRAQPEDRRVADRATGSGGPDAPRVQRPVVRTPAAAEPRQDTEEPRRPTPPPLRRTGPRRPRTLGRALLATAAATVAPGSGHLMLHRRRTGRLILGTFLAAVIALTIALLTLRRSDLLATFLSPRALVVAALLCVFTAAAWIAVIVRTWVVAEPRGLDPGRRAVGLVAVTALCLVVAVPVGFAANLANSQRALLADLFSDEDAGAVLGQARINLLLVGSDAGPDRTGTRTDTMMVASVETATGRTTLFSLPRNIGRAPFPPGSPMAEEFPDGFHDDSDPTSGDYLLNAVYAYAHQFPELAPPGPTDDVGLNLLQQTVSYMLGLQLDYFVELDMAGFAAIVDALGGVRVDVGPERVPIGGISPSGRSVTPTGYIEPGVQQLDGEDALAFARSRTNSTDYVRMGRQRCLLQSILTQNTPAELLANFQSIARATTDSVSTDIPQQVLPALVSIADGPLDLESVAFDPNLPDPEQDDGRFDTGNPDYDYMREVVRDALTRDPAAAPPTAAAAPSDIPETLRGDEDETASRSGSATADETSDVPLTSTPVPVARSC